MAAPAAPPVNKMRLPLLRNRDDLQSPAHAHAPRTPNNAQQSQQPLLGHSRGSFSEVLEAINDSSGVPDSAVCASADSFRSVQNAFSARRRRQQLAETWPIVCKMSCSERCRRSRTFTTDTPCNPDAVRPRLRIDQHLRRSLYRQDERSGDHPTIVFCSPLICWRPIGHERRPILARFSRRTETR